MPIGGAIPTMAAVPNAPITTASSIIAPIVADGAKMFLLEALALLEESVLTDPTPE